MSDDIVTSSGDSSEKIGRLPIRQEQFVASYVDPNSPTFSNGTRSYIAAGYKPGSLLAAAVGASKLLSSPKVQTRITAAMAAHGLSTEDRVRLLAATARGEGERRIERQQLVDGELRTVEVTIQQPSFAERNQALHLSNKLSGDYLAPQVAATAASERYKAMYRQLWAAHSKQRQPATDSSGDPAAAAADSSGS